MEERIQKVLSAQGYCSRRSADAMILSGRVTLNGRRAIPGDKVDVRKDVLAVDGQRVFLHKNPPKSYYLLNKPRGYVTTLDDERGRRCITDLIEDIEERVFPVGRLDMDSEGLLLLTNDGALANLVSHPSRGVTKLYRVSVKPAANEQQLAELASGVRLDGVFAQPSSVRVTGDAPDKTVMEIALKEGKNREIRRMCEAVGLTVTRLKRTSIGPLRLGNLPAGQHRALTKQELLSLRTACKKG